MWEIFHSNKMKNQEFKFAVFLAIMGIIWAWTKVSGDLMTRIILTIVFLSVGMVASFVIYIEKEKIK